MKFYAVKKGHKIGVFENWDDCQNAIKGFSGPDFKAFNTKEEADAYLLDKDLWKEQVSKDNAEGYLVAFVDGSFDKILKRYSYGVVLIKPNGNEESLCGHGNKEEYVESNNVIGEIFGVINALDWAVSNSFEKIKIYHDYEGLSKWVSGEWSAHSKVSQMYLNVYRNKFQDVLSINFSKVPAHSNVSYNERADQLAKSALIEKQKIAIQGDNWYSISSITEDDFRVIVDLIKESDVNIKSTERHDGKRIIFKFSLKADSVVVTLFKSGHQKLLVQGKNSCLFQIITTTIVELNENSQVEQILGSAYRISVESKKINEAYIPVKNGLPNNYPDNIKRLIKQSIINLKYDIKSEDYSQYAFPALRALEGHIKYLITQAGGSVGRTFNQFNKISPSAPYTYSGSLTNPTKKNSIEKCYNYYKSQRDTAFHYGEVLGSIDTTRIITTKEEADEIIKKCIDLINTER